MSNRKLEWGDWGNRSFSPVCTRCGEKHDLKCLGSSYDCFKCVNLGHKMKDCPFLTIKGLNGRKVQPSNSGLSASK